MAVRVESETGALRRAELLSVGTAEQVYLLLRVALAEHLASRSTVSPLLLDDVTVQADPKKHRSPRQRPIRSSGGSLRHC